MTTALHEILDQALAQFAEAHGGPKRLVIALSGGADSTALLVAASKHLRHRYPMLALHGDHQLNPDSTAWAEHCRTLCQGLGVPIQVGSLSVADQGNLEAAARQARYEFFLEHLEAGDLLLLGHHLQDQAETFLLRGLQGRGAMAMRDCGTLGPGYFLRPWLTTDKTLLTDYLTTCGVTWIEDPSNQQIDFDRNFLRHQVMPELTRRWANAGPALARVAANAGAQAALLESYVGSLGDQVPMSLLPRSTLQIRVWLRAYLSSRQHHEVSDRAIDELMRQYQHSGRAKMTLAGNTKAQEPALYIWRDHLYYEASGATPLWPTVDDPLPWCIPWRQQTLVISQQQTAVDGAMGYAGGLQVLSRNLMLPQDRGLTTTLKKRFQQAQIPPWRRGDYPLVCDDEGLLCMPGVWQRKATQLKQAPTGYCVIRWAQDSAGPG